MEMTRKVFSSLKIVIKKITIEQITNFVPTNSLITIFKPKRCRDIFGRI